MNEIDKQPGKNVDTADVPSQVSYPAASVSRRRLIKLGTAAVPVAATLASRPALAWHCQSPSAWGSEIINPNTSLKNSAGHASYIDETWTINNWKTNTPRTGNGLDDDGVAGMPWSELLSLCPGLYNNQTRTKSSNNKYYFDYRKVTVGHLTIYVPGFVNPGFSTAILVKDVSPNDLKTYPLFAQLNYLILKQVRFNNDIDRCIKNDQLAEMASGTYLENGRSWGFQKVKDYLYNNYIVRP